MEESMDAVRQALWDTVRQAETTIEQKRLQATQVLEELEAEKQQLRSEWEQVHAAQAALREEREALERLWERSARGSWFDMCMCSKSAQLQTQGPPLDVPAAHAAEAAPAMRQWSFGPQEGGFETQTKSPRREDPYVAIEVKEGFMDMRLPPRSKSIMSPADLVEVPDASPSHASAAPTPARAGRSHACGGG
mmetsp:Transcript_17288/g.54074  ORF Transcript_17288/g.54074 Transcript_17288/m.54074 type:complete len:192 (+) Transcript_17288:89-664(+)